MVKQLSFELPLNKGIVFYRQYGLREHGLKGLLTPWTGRQNGAAKRQAHATASFGGNLFGWPSVNRLREKDLLLKKICRSSSGTCQLNIS